MSAIKPEELEALLEQGQQDAARKDKAKKGAFKSDFEPLDQDDRDAPPFPKYGSDRNGGNSRPISRRGDDLPNRGRPGSSGSDGSKNSRNYNPYRDNGRPRDRDVYNGRYSDRRRSRSPRSPRDRYAPRDRDDRRRSGDYDPRRRGSDDNNRYRARSPVGDRHSPRNGGRGGENGGRRGYSPRRGGRRERTPEPKGVDSDARTVFVNQLANRLKTRQLRDFFEEVGPVIEATIVKDRVSGRSKGVGYVEFVHEDSVPLALNRTGHKLLGIPIIVMNSEAEKNRAARPTEGAPTITNGVLFHRLYIGNIHFNISEEDLEGIFGTYGEVEFIQLQKDDNTSRSKGHGFVQFINPDDARNALAELNGFELAGRPIRVGLGNDKMHTEAQEAVQQRFSAGQAQAFEGSSFSGAGGRGAHAGGSTNFENQTRRDDKAAANSSALDDSDVSGVNFNNYSRESLMKKLARTEDPAPTSAPVRGKPGAGKKPTATFQPSRCIIVKNAYKEEEETDPNWEKDLEDDFRDECSERYGKCVHAGIPSERGEGAIYIKFKDLDGGDKALKGLNGRFFGGNVLTAAPVVDAVYNVNFPKAAAL